MLVDLIQPVINGILLGGLYAAVANGLSMVFGVMRMVNLAHGDLLILASYGGVIFASWLGVSPLLALFAIVPLLFFLGFILQKYLFNRVIRKGMEPPLITALGLSIVIQNVLLLAFTPDARFLSQSCPSDSSDRRFRFHPVSLSSWFLLQDCRSFVSYTCF